MTVLRQGSTRHFAALFGAYHVKGFKDGKMEGEKRVYGTVAIDKTYEKVSHAADSGHSLKIVATKSDLITDLNGWSDIASAKVERKGRELAAVQLAYDNKNLYCRMDVIDASPYGE